MQVVHVSLPRGRGKTGGRARPVFLGNSFGVAVRALHEVNVVRALGGFEGRVHGFHVEAAIRQARMASGAGSARVHAVIFVAGEATEAFMNPHGRAVVAGVDLPGGNRSMALIAERLPWVAADLHEPGPLRAWRARADRPGGRIAFRAGRRAPPRAGSIPGSYSWKVSPPVAPGDRRGDA